MIVNRLSAICGERRLSVKDIERGAGISYGSAFKWYHDKASNYDREVLDKLCAYLDVGVGDLLVYRAANGSVDDHINE